MLVGSSDIHCNEFLGIEGVFVAKKRHSPQHRLARRKIVADKWLESPKKERPIIVVMMEGRKIVIGFGLIDYGARLLKKNTPGIHSRHATEFVKRSTGNDTADRSVGAPKIRKAGRAQRKNTGMPFDRSINAPTNLAPWEFLSRSHCSLPIPVSVWKLYLG